MAAAENTSALLHKQIGKNDTLIHPQRLDKLIYDRSISAREDVGLFPLLFLPTLLTVPNSCENSYTSAFENPAQIKVLILRLFNRSKHSKILPTGNMI